MVSSDVAGAVISVNGQVPDGEDLSWLWDVRFEHFEGVQVVAAGERATRERPLAWVTMEPDRALAEQVVADVLQSSFDSAGQRCSALRVLCLQEDVADRTLEMLTGAMRELSVGNPDRLSIDVGPVIDLDAKRGIDAHVAAMREKGRKVERVSMMWLPKTMSGRRDAQNLIDQHSIVRRAKLRGEIPEMPVLVDFSAPAAEQ